MPDNYWLFKAEPESRIVKGKDVKFSVDDFEAVKTSSWEGVRNYEARNIMKEMKVGDKALFYQSNCKNPGVAAFAEVCKEAYPDHSAWDPDHPYYDPKSDKNNPRWFMVDLTFKSRAKYLVPLSLLKRIADIAPGTISDDINYIGLDGCKSIKEMDLVTRGRLSVQRVSEKAWSTIQLLADTGGWDEKPVKKQRSRKRSAQNQEEDDGEDGRNIQGIAAKGGKNPSKKRKRKAAADGNGDEEEEEQSQPKVIRSRKN